MEKPGSASDSDGLKEPYTVFIDTNLDTHLAMIVFDSDTVSDLKKKIAHEHPLCFPNIGVIKIHALKIKRRGHFYHLSDSMFVKNAFNGAKKCWFLFVDASGEEEHGGNEHAHKPDSSNLVPCFGLTNNQIVNEADLLVHSPPQRLSKVDDLSLLQVVSIQHVKAPIAAQFDSDTHGKEGSKDTEMADEHTAKPDTSNRLDPIVQEKQFQCIMEHESLATPTGCREDNLNTGSGSRKKHKSKKRNRDAVDEHAPNEKNASVLGSNSHISQQGITIPENSLVNAGVEISYDMHMERKIIADGPSKSVPSDDDNKSSGPAVQRSNLLSEGDEVSGKNVECEDGKSRHKIVNLQLLGAASRHEPTAKKRRKIVMEKGNHSLVVQGPNNLEKDIRVSVHENVDDQIGGVEVTRELSENNDPKAMSSDQCKISGQYEIDPNTKGVTVNSKTKDPATSVKEKRKSRKKKDLVNGTLITSDVERNISSTEPPKVVGDQSTDKARNEEGTVPLEERKEVSKMKTMSASLSATDREIDDVIRNVVESVQQISKSQVNAENVDEKSRKKTKKRSSTAKSVSGLPTENKDVGDEGTHLSIDKTREANALSKTTRQINSVNAGFANQSNGSNLESDKYTEVAIDPLKGKPVDEANNWKQVTHESVSNSFLPIQSQPELVTSGEVFTDKKTTAKGGDELKAKKKKKKKVDVHSNGPLSDPLSSMKLNKNEANGLKTQPGNHSTIQIQGSLSKDEGDKVILQPSKKLTEISESGSKAPLSNKSDHLNSVPGERRTPDVFNPPRTSAHSEKSKKSKDTHGSLTSSLESSMGLSQRSQIIKGHQSNVNRNHGARQASGDSFGKVVNNTVHEKSLLAMSGAIFKDDGSGSSEDEGGVENSDASTRTPSDNSQASDYSDGESNALNSPQTGSQDLIRKEGGGKLNKTPFSSGPNSMTLDTILRSSNRYKKAKLTASQSQLEEDIESQPEFVPDSQGNQ